VLNLCGRGAEAEAASRHLVDLMPDSAEAHNNLAVALELQGRIAEAEEAGRKAVELNPDFLEAHINLGNLCFRRGDLDAASDLYQRAAEIDPQNPMPFGNLGVVFRRQGHLEDAEACCRHAISLKADYAEAHDALGNVLAAQGDMTGAVGAFRRAVELRDGYLEARANLAAGLFKLGDLAASEQAYRACVARYDAFAGAWAGLGTVLLAAGKTDDAVGAFRKAVEHQESLGDAWVNLAAAGALTADDEKALAGLLIRAEDGEQTAQLWFALAAAAEGRGDAAAAFDSYRKGNALRRRLLEASGRGFDGEGLDQRVTAIIGTVGRDGLAKLAAAGDPSEVPVFVVGMPRSGTTLVEQIISAHPQGAGAGEIDVLAGLLPDYPDGLLNLAPTEARDLAAAYLSRLTAGREGALRVVDKTPFNLFRLGLVQALFPRARVIHCLRDADDTAFSCFATNFAEGHGWSTDLGDIARVQAAADRLMVHWKQVLDLPVLEVSYEALVAGQEAESRRILDFLGLPWDPACLDFHKSGGAVLTASNWQVRKPLYKNAVGRARAFKPLIG